MANPIPTVFQFMALRLELKRKEMPMRTNMPIMPRPRLFNENPSLGIICVLGLGSMSFTRAVSVKGPILSDRTDCWAKEDKPISRTNKRIQRLQFIPYSGVIGLLSY